MKLVSDIIAEIRILEILNINFSAVLILGLIWPNSCQVFHENHFETLKSKSVYFKYLMCQISINSKHF